MKTLKFELQQVAPVAISKAKISLGREAQNDVVLDDASVSAFHAEILTMDDKVYIVDLGSTNGVVVNGQKISGRTELKGGDTLLIANIKAIFVDPSARVATQLMPAIDAPAAQPASTGNEATLRWQIRPVLGGRPVAINGKTIVGRENSDLLIESPDKAISRQHAELYLEHGQLFIKDLSSANGTFVNGVKVSSQVLKDGDELRFDQKAYRVIDLAANATQIRPAVDANATQLRPAVDANATQLRPAVSPANATAGQSAQGTKIMPAVSSAQAQLTVVKGQLVKKTFTLTQSKYEIGRSPQCDISLPDDSLSTKHAQLSQQGSGWLLRDLGSTNGSKVNGKAVKEALLQHSDAIHLGEVVLSFKQQATSAGQTQQMKAATPAAGILSRIPAWAYGIAGFALVGALLSGLLFRDNLVQLVAPAQINAPLQSSQLWAFNTLGNARIISTPVVADINGDKFLDVVVADQSGRIYALDGEEGKLIFQVSAPDAVIAPLAAADLTGNGKPEVVVTTSTGTVMTLDGSGKVLWSTENQLDLGAILAKPVIADINDDGQLDILVATGRRGLVALDGNRGWEIWHSQNVNAAPVVSAPVLGDFNNDGATDIFVLHKDGTAALFSTQAGKVWQLWQQTTGASDFAAPVLIGKKQPGLLVPGRQGLFALDAQSGRVQWQALANQQVNAVDVLQLGKEQRLLATLSNGDLVLINPEFGEVDSTISASQGARALALIQQELTGDSTPELITLSRKGQLDIIDPSRLRSLYQSTLDNKGFIAAPLLADLNKDGLINLIVAAESGTVSVHSLNRTVRKGQSLSAEFAIAGSQP